MSYRTAHILGSALNNNIQNPQVLIMNTVMKIHAEKK